MTTDPRHVFTVSYVRRLEVALKAARDLTRELERGSFRPETFRALKLALMEMDEE